MYNYLPAAFKEAFDSEHACYYCIQILNLLKINIPSKEKAKVERVALFWFFMDYFSWRLYESVVFLQLPQPLKPNILEGLGKCLVFFEVHAHAHAT